MSGTRHSTSDIRHSTFRPATCDLRLATSLILCSLMILAGGACGKKNQIRTPTPAPASAKTTAPLPQPPAKAPPERSSKPAAPREQIPAVPPPSRVQSPIRMRVGLEIDRTAITVQAPTGTQMLVEEDGVGMVAGKVEIVLPMSGSAGAFWVQISAPRLQDEANRILQEYEQQGFHGVSRWNEGVQRYQVRLGPFSTRETAENVKKRATPDAFVAEDRGSETIPAEIQANGSQWDAYRFQLRPEEGRYLRLNNRSYRGWFEVFVNRRGNLTLVNVVALEDYLKGVVPNELSPYLFPQIEALKAQSVAARTYAVRNRGQNKSDGFDLFSTIRSQVYGGVESERELSSQAVAETEGLIAVYNDEPIEALYCSTCGGHTEDSSNVFSSKNVPYLKGVVCLGEATLNEESGGLTIPAEQTLDFDLGLVNASGIELLSRDEEFLSRTISLAEMQAWTRRVAAFARRPMASIADDDVQSFFLWVSRAHGEGEAEARYTARDASLLLKGYEDLDLLDLKLRPHVAWLIELRILEPEGKRLLPPLPLRRKFVLDVLGKLLRSSQEQFLIRGRIERVNPGSLEIDNGSGRVVYSLAPSVILYRRENQSISAQNSIRLRGGEQILYFAEQGTLKLLLLEAGGRTPNNNSKLAPYAYWEYKISRGDLSRRINSLLPVGSVRDIVPMSHGVSGRVLKLKVISTKGETILSGARLRTALGLRDTLFTLQKAVNDEGTVEQFVFRGRGWGHGVGLCQIGSVGLARQGKNFVEILKSYYTGIEVKPMAVE
ncbi:MAG TPA: SpoIID/LytB domain-containing protein [Acidobacteriota bacterium]